MTISLIDYGAGNLTSVRKALAAIGAGVFTPARPDAVREGDAIIIPGVGHYAATSALGREWREAILRSVLEGRPLLGICLGMQLLYDGSDEDPALPGLGLLQGRCSRLSGDVKIPHVGWNDLLLSCSSRLCAEVESGQQVYFTHSYAAPVTDAAVATTEHGERFASAVERPPIFGVQFHPEKSGAVGLTILRNFLAEVHAER